MSNNCEEFRRCIYLAAESERSGIPLERPDEPPEVASNVLFNPANIW